MCEGTVARLERSRFEDRRGEMADSGSAAGASKLSLSTVGGGGGSRDGRLVISGVKAGDGSGPRVFLLR